MGVLIETCTLSNGDQIPKIGFGTWLLNEGEECYNAVAGALRIGYRHIDTARAYHNEASVGRAVRDSGIPRGEIYVTSKLPAEAKDYDNALEEFETTMGEIGLDYLDLYLIHAPWPWNERGKDCREENRQIWKAMEKFLDSGRVKAIGVSNFDPDDLDSLIPACQTKPMVNQIRWFIGLDPSDTVQSAPNTTSSSRPTPPSRTASSSTIPRSVTWLPATGSAHHRYASATCCKKVRSCCPRRPRPATSSRTPNSTSRFPPPT
jgi:diketogulonate reductase-like aldo/keto reductase